MQEYAFPARVMLLRISFLDSNGSKLFSVADPSQRKLISHSNDDFPFAPLNESHDVHYKNIKLSAIDLATDF